VIPASVQKVMVGAAALEVLGPDFTYTTEVRSAPPVDGVVSGNLHLIGGGDPVLSGDWYPTANLETFPVFNHTSLDTLADSVVAAGVRRVVGDVVGDGSRYDDEWFAPGWGAGVAGLEAGPYDALMANDARVLGDDLRASDPNQAAARELVRLLGDRGVEIGGTAVSGTTPDGLDLIAAIDSLPLPAIVDEMLANSDNNTAELMVKEMGHASSGEGTRPAGLAAMLTVFQSWGIDVSELVLADGSGLSPSNLLTCDAVLAVLQRFDPDGHLGTGFPVAGTSGTLRNVFTESPVAGRLLGKTGTLNNPPFNQDPPAVKGLAGYLPVEGGGAIEYSLLLNGPTISDQSEYRPVWDLLARVLDSYPAGAGPAVLGPR
jgi:serine-type D-Ala-D-Ala carboxypeptidase/endopeptidase (penicillin-binding protein 4)